MYSDVEVEEASKLKRKNTRTAESKFLASSRICVTALLFIPPPQENPDLFKWFTGQLAAPESVKGNFAFRAIHEEVQRRMRVGNTLSMNTSGAEWVRGWNDKK